VIANSSGQCLEAPHSRTARLKRQMSKSKYQMVVALRAVIESVPDSSSKPLLNGCNPSFDI
jgi:hypothetical protein